MIRSILKIVQDPCSSLLDNFGRRHTYLRVSITDRCNFRCTYCMPEHGISLQPKGNLLSFEEIERFVRVLVQRGVTKVRLTGGEPTARRDYLLLVERLTQIECLQEVTMTTNGTSLKQDAAKLLSLGVTTLNVSLDTLNSERFARITRRDMFSVAWEGIHEALRVGLRIKINCVVMPGINDDEVLDFVELARELPITVRFIEFMPFLDNNWSLSGVISSQDLRDRIELTMRLLPTLRKPGQVATTYKIAHFVGDIDFVSSVTESFCEDCNRLRLTAEGTLKSCLFLPGTVSIRDLLRENATDEELISAVKSCLNGKWKEHPQMKNWNQLDQLAMVQIGG